MIVSRWILRTALSRLLILSLLATCGIVGNARGQETPRLRPPGSTHRSRDISKKTEATSTILEVELLQVEGSGLHSQKWLKAFEPHNISVRIHKASSDEKPKLSERESGTIRYVTAVGLLDRSGMAHFPGHDFHAGDAAQLKAWIEELKTYGVQGSPEGQPLWGLTKEQFNKIYDGLVKTVDQETLDQPLLDVVRKLPIAVEYKVQWSPEATRRLKEQPARNKVMQELKGLSTGTVLAIALSDAGLGFRPQRTPGGAIELLVESHDPKIEQWPVGWPLLKQPNKAAPKLYAMVPIELSDVELNDVLDAISQLSETPILLDRAELDARQIRLDKIKVSFPARVTTWTIALRQMVGPQKLVREVWQDEAGHVFIWITSIHAGRAKDADKAAP